MKLRRRMALYWYSEQFAEYGLTHYARKLWVNFVSWVMIVRIEMTADIHNILKNTISIIIIIMFEKGG